MVLVLYMALFTVKLIVNLTAELNLIAPVNLAVKLLRVE